MKTLIKPCKGLKHEVCQYEWNEEFRENANKTLQGIKTRHARCTLQDANHVKTLIKPCKGLKLPLDYWRNNLCQCENANKTLQGIKTVQVYGEAHAQECENANKTLQGIKTTSVISLKPNSIK